MNIPGRKPRRLAAAAGAMLLLTAASTGAFAAELSSCLDPARRDALQVREVQTHLMVAALACDAAAEYNAFVKRFTPTLVRHSEHMRRYFATTYGPDGASHLNRFVTDLANRVSQLSATAPVEFCARTVQLFQLARAESLASLLPSEVRTVSVDGASCRIAVR